MLGHVKRAMILTTVTSGLVMGLGGVGNASEKLVTGTVCPQPYTGVVVGTPYGDVSVCQNITH